MYDDAPMPDDSAPTAIFAPCGSTHSDTGTLHISNLASGRQAPIFTRHCYVCADASKGVQYLEWDKTVGRLVARLGRKPVSESVKQTLRERLPSGHSVARLRALVVSVVDSFRADDESEGGTLDEYWDDLIQDGMLAGVKADQAYAADKGQWWRWVTAKVRRDISRAVQRYQRGGVTADEYAESTLQELPEDDETIPDNDLEFYWDVDRPLLDRIDVAQKLHVLRRRMPAESYRLLTLHYGVWGAPQSTRDIAKQLNTSTMTIHRKIKSALESAASMLGRYST